MRRFTFYLKHLAAVLDGTKTTTIRKSGRVVNLRAGETLELAFGDWRAPEIIRARCLFTEPLGGGIRRTPAQRRAIAHAESVDLFTVDRILDSATPHTLIGFRVVPADKPGGQLPLFAGLPGVLPDE